MTMQEERSHPQRSNFKVERGVPLPHDNYNAGAITVERNMPMPQFQTITHKYPWRLMDVGTSFFVPGKNKASFAAYCRDKGKKLGVEFRCENATAQGGVEGVRVWRTR